MIDEKPKRIMSDIRPPARKPQTQPKVQQKATEVKEAVEKFVRQDSDEEHEEQPMGKKVLGLVVITILSIAIWLAYINYFS